jgi:hypothetical protein
VQTLGKPPLKTNGLAAGYVPNCEGWVKFSRIADEKAVLGEKQEGKTAGLRA